MTIDHNGGDGETENRHDNDQHEGEGRHGEYSLWAGKNERGTVTVTFGFVLLGTIVLVGALLFLPAAVLGPVAEHLGPFPWWLMQPYPGAFGICRPFKHLGGSTELPNDVKRADHAKGFVVEPKRWIVQRSIAWLNRCRRLAKDWENRNHNALAFLHLASIRLLLRRICNPS